MKSTVVDESLSSFKPMYCSREYQTSTRLNQQYEKSTLNPYIEVNIPTLVPEEWNNANSPLGEKHNTATADQPKTP